MGWCPDKKQSLLATESKDCPLAERRQCLAVAGGIPFVLPDVKLVWPTPRCEVGSFAPTEVVN